MSGAPGTLRELVGAYLGEQCAVLEAAEPGLRAGEPVIHPTRVAARRLRSTLRVFGDLLDVPRAAALEDELVWWAGLLGAVRDLEVLSARFAEQLAELPAEEVLGPVSAEIEAEIGAQHRQAREVMLAALDSERYARLVAELERWRVEPPLTPAAEVDAKAVKRYVRRADRKVGRRLGQASDAFGSHDDAAAHELLHRARKAGKRARYAAEAAAPLGGSRWERLVAERKHLQDVLGAQQDSVVAAAFLRDLGARLGSRTGHNGFTYGLLYARERQRQEQAAEEVKEFLS